MPAYKIYEKSSTNEVVHVFDVRVVKHLQNDIEVNDIDSKDTGDWQRDTVLYKNEDELKDLGFVLVSET